MDVERVKIYCRGENLPFQAGIAAAFVKNRGLTCSNVYVDEQGLEAWKKLTEDCARITPDAIIVSSIDVLTDDANGMQLLDELLPVPIIGAEDLFCTKENLNLETLQYEKAKRGAKREEARNNLDEYRQQHPQFEKEDYYTGGIAPFGYSRVKGRLVRNPDTSVFVEPLFIKAKDGEKLTEIASWLSEEGVPTPRGGSGWSDNTVRDILKNTVYIDDLISRDLYDAVQVRFGSRTPSEKKEPGFYQGIVLCSTCGKPMAYHGAGGKDRRKTAIYSCKYHTGKNPKEEPLPHMPKIDEKTLKKEVLAQCNSYIRSMSENTSKMDSAIKKFETRKKKLEDQLTLLGRNVLERKSMFRVKVPNDLWTDWEKTRRKYIVALAQRDLLLHRFEVYRPEEMTENDYEEEKKLYQSISISPGGNVKVHFWGDTAFRW